jgi:hypothetical protein
LSADFGVSPTDAHGQTALVTYAVTTLIILALLGAAFAIKLVVSDNWIVGVSLL